MWDVTVPVVGRCRACGEELGTEINVRATLEWVRHYQRDERLRRSVDQAVVHLVVARHTRGCLGQLQRPLALAAAGAQ